MGMVVKVGPTRSFVSSEQAAICRLLWIGESVWSRSNDCNRVSFNNRWRCLFDLNDHGGIDSLS
ncbi:hypothetical protein AALP_AAs60715U000100 [Arabis alpina]|uniref:Uncharacterized protein n=1 Tax=Arabis alpina TaxID=50452 RepID=A0A087G2L6_ARAAL|nr:hypothetical protein AALP_AAs60715U000100 [Arabis alpina]